MSIPQPSPKQSGGMGCLKIGLMGCGAIALVLLIAMIAMGYYVSRGMPEVKQMSLCIQNMQKINGALDRYQTRNGNYPETLSQIVPDFLSDPAVLHCPSDKSGSKTVSYIYTKPPAGAPAKTIILVCERHSIMKKHIGLYMQKDGQITQPGQSGPPSR